MSRFLAGCAVLVCLPLLLCGAPTPPPLDLSGVTKEDIIKTIQHRDQLHLELQTKFDEQQTHIVRQDGALIDATEALSSATKQNGILQIEIQKVTDSLNTANDKLEHCAKALWWYRLHFWLGIVLMVVGIVGCVIVWGGKILVKLGIKSAI